MNFMGSSPNAALKTPVQQCLEARGELVVLNIHIVEINHQDSLNYTWTNQGGKQVALSAPTYIDSVMSSIQNLLDDENVFPTKSSEPAFAGFHPLFIKLSS